MKAAAKHESRYCDTWKIQSYNFFPAPFYPRCNCAIFILYQYIL